MYSQNKSASKIWGFFAKDSQVGIPLKSLDIKVHIVHTIARVFYTQVYQNNVDVLLETEFFFPISPDACFDSFEAKFNDVTIKGVVKEKNQAKQEYNEAIIKGKTAAYSEINQETGDIMKVMIGNIPHNTEISITYSYIQKLETTMNKFWCFRLFSTLTSRYNGDLNEYLKRDISLLANYPTISSGNKQAYHWNIEVEVQSPSPITFLQSPSHEIVTKYGNESHTCTITLNPNNKHTPNKDFVLLFSNGRENKIDYLLTPFGKEEYCAMVTLLADFENIAHDKAYENLAKAKVEESHHSMDTVRGEYIFLIDRSGSMDGDRITMARTSLVLFLKSLPKDSYFNVVSFGDSYSFLYKASQKYSQESLEACCSKVEKFKADMGGTEIYAGLDKVFQAPAQKGYPKFIFLVTDGAVSNTQQVLDLISANSHKARVFTIGIGNGCSPELIVKGATCGRGKHEFVENTKDIYGKVISLLDTSLSPSYSDLSLEANNFDAVVKSVSPDPALVPFLLNGQPITFFLILREAAFHNDQKMTLKLHFYDSRIQNHRTVEVVLDTTHALKNDLLPKLAIHDMIKRLEAQKKDTNNKHIVWIDKEEINQTLLDLSLNYGILCKDTAFFCEISSTSQPETRSLQPVKVIVPTTLSKDYDRLNYAQSTNYAAAGLFGALDDDECFDDYDECFDQEFMAQKCMPQKCCAVEEDYDAGLGGGLFGDDDGCDDFEYSPPSRNMPAAAASYSYTKAEAKKEERYEEEEEADIGCGGMFDDFDSAAPVQTITSKESMPFVANNKPNPSSYLEVIMKQLFEGSWDHSDKALKALVLKNGNLTDAPKELEVDKKLSEKVWMTVAVLLWLEVVCQSEKQAWRLIHQKGCEWLKNTGVNYEQVKDLAKSVINA